MFLHDLLQNCHIILSNFIWFDLLPHPFNALSLRICVVLCDSVPLGFLPRLKSDPDDVPYLVSQVVL